MIKAGGRINTIRRAHKKISRIKENLGSMDITFTGKFECKRDNLIIRGKEYREKEGKLPALILSHGYLANQKMCADYAKLASGLGYAAFTFDFNGGGLGSKSSGKSMDMTVLSEIEDLKAVIRYVGSKTDIDAGHISLLGCSQGGVVSAITAKQYPGIHSLILLYPAFCIPDDARSGRMMFAHFDPARIPTVIQRFPMKLSGRYAACVQKWDIPDMAGGYDGPVLYLQGTRDRVVELHYAREAQKLYPNVKYYEIEGGGHMFRGKHDRIAQSIIKEFLGR